MDVRWSERQFVLPGHVANKIGIGATRNLVVRRCDPRHTAKSIVEDLEHIHNLVVIRVEFLNSSCYISTNSVHNAMFARTCMMSRGYDNTTTRWRLKERLLTAADNGRKYKGSKIEWDADECAQPLERPPHVTNGPGGRQPPRRENSRSMAHQRRKSAAGAAGVVNRFQLLNLDPDDGKSDDENGNAEDGSTRPGGSLAGPAVALPTAANEVGIAA